MDRPVQWTDFCEDAELVPSHGVVLLTCDPGRHEWNTVMGPLANPDPRGALWVYDYKTTGAGAEIVKLRDFPDRLDFHPLGIAVFEQAEPGPLRVFAINHQRLRSTVEVFDLLSDEQGWVAQYVRSIAHPFATHTPNSLVALSATEFLVTQDHLFARRAPPTAEYASVLSGMLSLPPVVADTLAKGLSQPLVAGLFATIETFLGLPLGWVSHVSFTEAGSEDVTTRVIARDIPFANGIAVSEDGASLHVAACTYPGVYMYDIRGNGVSLRERVHLPFNVDNLSVSGGRLIAAGHPQGLKLTKMARAPFVSANAAPSWVVSVAEEADSGDDSLAPSPAEQRVLSQSERWKIQTLYQGNGTSPGVPSSSTGVWDPTDGTLIVTGLYGKGILACHSVDRKSS